MRGTTLNALIQMLRRELKLAESPALGSNTRESHAHALRSAQQRLYDEHDWPIKFIKRDVTLAAGQRYYAPPSDMNLENIGKIEVYYSGQWFPVIQGITSADYNALNPETNSRNDPARRWDFYNDPDNGDMIEVWPLPASNGSLMRFYGQRTLSALIADTDTCDLDDLLIVLFAATDLCPAKDRQYYAAKADGHLLSQKRKLANKDTFVSGGGSNPNERRGYPHRIVITPAPSGG